MFQISAILLNFQIDSYMLGQSVPQLIYAIVKLVTKQLLVCILIVLPLNSVHRDYLTP